MEPINIEKLQQQFAGTEVDICIYDNQGEDQPPSVKKWIKKIQLCPDSTHVRFYFDHANFLAVPLASQVKQSQTEWKAIDAESGLHYTIKKVQVS